MRHLKVLTIILLLLFIIINFKVEVFANIKNQDITKDILIINSYDSENKWEKSVLRGFNSVIQDYSKYSINLSLEYLDIKKRNDKDYITKFESLIESKYKDTDIDLIVVIDDEAFNLARAEVSNFDSIFYKKPLVFIGVNQEINLTEEEREYITGFIDTKNKLQIVDLISNLQPNIDTINILLDNTYYNKKIKDDISNSMYLLNRDVMINFITSEYEEVILDKVKDMKSNQAIVISGIFKNKVNEKYITPKEFVQKIKKVSNSPIYTDREDYTKSNIIGGFVDVGKENGSAVAKMALKILEGKEVKNISLTNEPNGRYVFDYKEIYKYDVDILNIPKGSIILNNEKNELLIPKVNKNIIKFILAMMIVLVIFIIYVIYTEKKNSLKNKKLYYLAKEREQLKNDFIVNMSHELRTPLNVIISISKLLEMKANKGEIEKEYLLEKLNRINQNSSRLTRLINNLIDISKFEAGFYEYKCRDINIVYLIEEIVFESVDFANQKEIELIFDTQEEEIITCVDTEKIERAMLNLLSNAIKFTPKKGKIEVLVNKYKESIKIVVKDNGIGIPKDKLEQIFHRFYQIDSSLSRSNEGSGIGLFIVAEIVKIHEGTIKVYSEENKGTTFEIILPIKHCDKMVEDKSIQNIDFKDIVKLEMSDIDK